MAKTKDEIVNNAMRDWKKKHESDDNWLKSRVQGAWESGYRNGIEAAWEAAKKIHGIYTINEMENLFKCDMEKVMDEIDPQSAIDMLEEFEAEEREKQEIHLGDEVEAWDTNAWVKFIAIGDDGCEMIVGFDLNGGIYEYPRSACRKTGEHYTVSHTCKPKEKDGENLGATDNHY